MEGRGPLEYTVWEGVEAGTEEGGRGRMQGREGEAGVPVVADAGVAEFGVDDEEGEAG